MGSIPVAGTTHPAGALIIVGVLKDTLIRSGRTYSVVMLDAGGIAKRYGMGKTSQMSMVSWLGKT